MRVIKVHIPKKHPGTDISQLDTSTQWWHLVTSGEPTHPWFREATRLLSPTYHLYLTTASRRAGYTAAVYFFCVPDGQCVVPRIALDSPAAFVLLGRPVVYLEGDYYHPEVLPVMAFDGMAP